MLILVLGLLAWQGYLKYQSSRVAGDAREEPVQEDREADSGDRTPASAAPGGFKCDGRTYCSQMTSCAEATFFLRNCPGVKMDGDGDGVPCERQWCK